MTIVQIRVATKKKNVQQLDIVQCNNVKTSHHFVMGKVIEHNKMEPKND